jgi:aryl-alcohol dehydrogenase-like predicted oxidoreductase
MTVWAQDTGRIKKTIPATGEQLTPVGIGTNRYGVGNSADARAPLQETLARFHVLGGQLIDTAEEYGSSENVIGDLSQNLGVNPEFFFASKVRMIGREAGIRSIEQSLTRLRRTQVDLMQVHDLIDYATQIDTLRTLKTEGRVRYIGVTTAGDEHHSEIEHLMSTDEFDFVQLSYSLNDRRAAERLLPLAADRGIAVLVNRPFGRGNIFRTIGNRPLPAWASEFDCTSWAQFFLKYIISHPAVTCAIPGTRTAAHALDNLGAAHGRLPDAALRNRMERLFDDLA